MQTIIASILGSLVGCYIGNVVWSFLSKAKRSEALQGGPPSAGGSARPLAVDHSPADSLVCSARVSGPIALVQKWKKEERNFLDYQTVAATGTERLRAGAYATIYGICAEQLEEEIQLLDARPAAGEQAVARNAPGERPAKNQ